LQTCEREELFGKLGEAEVAEVEFSESQAKLSIGHTSSEGERVAKEEALHVGELVESRAHNGGEGRVSEAERGKLSEGSRETTVTVAIMITRTVIETHQGTVQ